MNLIAQTYMKQFARGTTPKQTHTLTHTITYTRARPNLFSEKTSYLQYKIVFIFCRQQLNINPHKQFVPAERSCYIFQLEKCSVSYIWRHIENLYSPIQI